ncbi:SAM-dependent methyltransferase [Pseudonocardia sp. GCM10023141]|uniref:SAM-dependent methyltransferase n=1 Tax=Pseudonocardia sp. GCM10023141 TaxID=3252653 RepID=UPI00360C4201
MANPATGTAVGPMVIVALDQHETHPLVRDALAARMLPAGARPVAALARWAPVRRLVVGLSEKRIPGLWAGILCRKRYIDEVVSQHAGAGAAAAVVLGAGLDTRAYRLPTLAAMPVYEVDLPATIDRKRARLRAIYGSVPAHVTLVPTDFEAGALAGTLAAAGYRRDGTTVFVMEAVTQYLTAAAVQDTFDTLGEAPAGSRLLFTYVRSDFLDGRNRYGADAAYQDFVVRRPLWKFGMDPVEVAGFLADNGWRLVEQVGAAEFAERYVLPSGRDLPVTEIERVVHAEKV